MKKAEGSLRVARIAIKEGEFDSAVMNAVHSAINSLDALTTFYLGRRASGAHTDAMLLVRGILGPDEYLDVQKQFASLLSMKNASEYQPDLMNAAQAEKAAKWAERIAGRVKEKMKGRA